MLTVILINKYQIILFCIMGCCWSEAIEDVPKLSNSTDPILPNSKYQQASAPRMGQLQTGQSLKLKGNEHFKRKQFGLAIEAYSKAIVMSVISQKLPNPNISYYSNLALAYKANGQYEQSIDTVDEMIRRPAFHSNQNSQLFRKAQIIKSRCIIIQARDYCLSANYTQKQSQQKLTMVNTAVSLLKEITSLPNRSQEFQSYLASGTKIKLFLQKQVLPRSKKQSLVQYLQSRLSNNKLEGPIKQFYDSQEAIVSEITLLVRQQMNIALRQPDEFIVDPITYDIFESPVIVPSGQSYDEKILKEHFKNNGYNDPITHEVYKIGEKVLVRNVNLSNYISEVRKTVNKADLDFLKY